MKTLPAILFAAFCATAHAHQHFAAGYLDSNGNNQRDPGEPLRLVTAPAADAIFHMLPKLSGRYAGYFLLDGSVRVEYPNDAFTFTALSDGQAEAAHPSHAATGSYIWMEITSVTGPEGATFGFWEGLVYQNGVEQQPWAWNHNTPTVSFLANQPTGGFKFEISEPIFPNDPTEDPYGHIHERGWTADMAGDYFVTFTLHDMSTNGPDGGPIHSPSEGYTFHFVAVPEPGTVALLAIAGGIAVAAAWRRRKA